MNPAPTRSPPAGFNFPAVAVIVVGRAGVVEIKIGGFGVKLEENDIGVVGRPQLQCHDPRDSQVGFEHTGDIIIGVAAILMLSVEGERRRQLGLLTNIEPALDLEAEIEGILVNIVVIAGVFGLSGKHHGVVVPIGLIFERRLEYQR